MYPIIAISTPIGFSGIGIIKISFGNSNIDFKHFFNIIFKKNLIPRYATFVNLYCCENNSILDNGLAIFFKKPHSYTSEDILEFHGHGNPFNLKFILKYFLFILKKYKIRLSMPGEFTKRAFLNNKINLIELENLYNILNIKSKYNLKIFHNFLKIDISLKIKKIITLINNLIIILETSFNFYSDTKIIKNINYLLFYILKKISIVLKKIKLKCYNKKLNIIFLGQPNVGKSTLINLFVKKNLSLVSSVPGTTRDSLIKNIFIENYSIDLIDTAGLFKTNNKLEKNSINISFKNFKNSDIIFYLLDNSNFLDFNYFKIKNSLNVNQYFLEIQNKIDLTNKFISLEFFLFLKKRYTNINISSKYNLGVNILRNELCRIIFFFNKYLFFKSIINCAKLLFIAKKNILKSLSFFKNKQYDFILYYIYKSKKNLSFLINSNFKNKKTFFLNKLFDKFCIGK